MITITADMIEKLDIIDCVLLETADNFYNLGNLSTEDGGRDSAVASRVRCAWKKMF